MEFTFDHMIYIFGILLGVSLTLIGVGFTEYLKNRKLKQRLINALYEEIRENIKKSEANLKNSKNRRLKVYVPFHTIACQQFKLALMIDEKIIPDLSNNLVNAYIFAELFNKKIDEYEKDRTNRMGEIPLLENVNKHMNQLKEKIDPFIKEDKP